MDDLNTKISFQTSAFWNVVYKTATILFTTRCDNTTCHTNRPGCKSHTHFLSLGLFATMVRLNLCFYLKSGLCTLFISFAFLILMFTQEMRYQEFINTLHQENTQLRDGLIKSNNALLKTKVVKRGLDLMHKDHNVSRRAANHKPIEIHAQNDYDNVKHKEEIPQDAPHQDIKPTQKGLVVDPKYVPDLRDWWYFSNISIWKNASQLTFTDNVEPEKNLKEMPGRNCDLLSKNKCYMKDFINATEC